MQKQQDSGRQLTNQKGTTIIKTPNYQQHQHHQEEPQTFDSVINLGTLNSIGSMQDLSDQKEGSNRYMNKYLDFDMKLKRRPNSSERIDEYREMGVILENKNHLFEYIENMQQGVDYAQSHAKALIDKRYRSMINALVNASQRFQNEVERMKNLQQELEQDPERLVIESDIQKYQQFQMRLNTEIEQIQSQLDQEQEKSRDLQQVLKYKGDSLLKINHENLRISSQATRLKHNLQMIKTNQGDFERSSIKAEGAIADGSDTPVLKEDQEAYQLQSSILTNIFQSQQASASNLWSMKQDPIQKIQAFCGTTRKIAQSSVLLSRFSKKLTANIIKAEQQQAFAEKISSQYEITQKQLTQKPYVSLNPQNAINIVGQLPSQGNEIGGGILDSMNHSVDFDVSNKSLDIDADMGSSQAGMSSRDELTYIRGKTEFLAKRNQQLKNAIISKSNQFFQLLKLYEDCINIERRYLENSQKRVNKDGGMNGSLLFEIKRAQFFLTESQMDQFANVQQTSLQDRQIRSLVHDTLRQWVDDREGQSKKSSIDQLVLEWDSFKQFLPLQIFGLLVLQPELLELMKQEFENKGRKIKDEMEQNKIFVNYNK